MDSKALCSTGSYARPPVERDKGDSGFVDAEHFQVPLIFIPAGSVDLQDLLVLKLALDHTFETHGRSPVERDKRERHASKVYYIKKIPCVLRVYTYDTTFEIQ